MLSPHREASPGSKVKDIYRFKDPIEVEIIARVARYWIDDEVRGAWGLWAVVTACRYRRMHCRLPTLELNTLCLRLHAMTR